MARTKSNEFRTSVSPSFPQAQDEVMEAQKICFDDELPIQKSAPQFLVTMNFVFWAVDIEQRSRTGAPFDASEKNSESSRRHGNVASGSRNASRHSVRASGFRE